MRKRISFYLIVVTAFVLLGGCSLKTDQMASPQKGETVAEIKIKEYGSIYVRFFKTEAPKAVENFVTHAKDGYYNGLTFHRIINDFMIQGGDPTGTGTGGESIWGKEFKDEFSDILQPVRGSLCMANAGPDTNGSQFFIVQTGQTYDKDILTQAEKELGVKFNDIAVEKFRTIGGTPWLYRAHTVFGQVYEGLDVLDAVAAVEADGNGKPQDNVIIEAITIFEYKE
ncbi:peptidyl-prolyl cis-trans isomerase [Anaerocolumna cellulosilytica]|uniref:Peptidyl-prolyl cis-trans isomerase n=1 Tax=Anaerocolumna cellulosilytica TaxID=433286 RepID=A0A6S6R9P9_9FIRM|nr:peptidylprolyl isomerase [Anaerocolumna cellulosilytica]MBB5196567.1 peptidyl-prolyl cis-trans isomerase B (cyclophilin B) [Anaerocolumna cellulosilytica]BCJ95668.1 peptidyl-prolyl cis-trans isomerase [Anaerocolumna cellulosilytica]